MADDNILDEIKDLENEARRAVLKQIVEVAPKSGLGRIEELARAYALVVGAARGSLPGQSPVVNAK